MAVAVRSRTKGHGVCLFLFGSTSSSSGSSGNASSRIGIVGSSGSSRNVNSNSSSRRSRIVTAVGLLPRHACCHKP
jgi:hypothetical protein